MLEVQLAETPAGRIEVAALGAVPTWVERPHYTIVDVAEELTGDLGPNRRGVLQRSWHRNSNVLRAEGIDLVIKGTTPRLGLFRVRPTYRPRGPLRRSEQPPYPSWERRSQPGSSQGVICDVLLETVCRDGEEKPMVDQQRAPATLAMTSESDTTPMPPPGQSAGPVASAPSEASGALAEGFFGPQTAELVGISYRQLDHWAARGW